MDHQELLQSLGLSKNEAKIYETLLRQGEVGVGVISENPAHRRNVYDSLNRLMEKGLVFEIVGRWKINIRLASRKATEIVVESSKRWTSAVRNWRNCTLARLQPIACILIAVKRLEAVHARHYQDR